MTKEDPTPIDDDESYYNGVRYETWTDRENGLAYVRADFRDDNADFPTLAERPDSSSDESAPIDKFENGTVFGASGLETMMLKYPYYTGAEKVAPYERHFTPDWAIDAFERHGYDVLDPDEMPEDDAEIITDGGETETSYYKVSVTVTARLPQLGYKDYTFSMKVSDPDDTDEAEQNAKSLIPEDGKVNGVDINVREIFDE